MDFYLATTELINNLSNKYDIWDTSISQEVNNFYDYDTLCQMSKGDFINLKLSCLLNLIVYDLITELKEYDLSEGLIDTIQEELICSIRVEYTETYLESRLLYSNTLKELINIEIVDEIKREEIKNLFQHYTI